MQTISHVNVDAVILELTPRFAVLQNRATREGLRYSLRDAHENLASALPCRDVPYVDLISVAETLCETAPPYVHYDRDAAILEIRRGLKARSGKDWSVTGGSGTAWGWIKIQAPPRRRIDGMMSTTDRVELGKLLDLGRASYSQGESVAASYEYRAEWVARAKGERLPVIAEPYWD